MADNEESRDEFDDDEGSDTTEMLIEAVKSHPVLYSTSHKEYKMLGKKEIIWEQISESLGSEVSWCKAKWKYLRNNYVAKKKVLRGKSGNAAIRIKRWVYFKSLMFLDAEYADAPIDDIETTGNVDFKPKDENDVDSDEESCRAEPGTLYYTPSRKRKSSVKDPLDEARIMHWERQDKKSRSHRQGDLG